MARNGPKIAVIASLYVLSLVAQAQEDPIIAGPWVSLRKAPTFGSPVQELAPTWGPSIPIGNSFRVEKVYGRWLYGTPVPLARMKSRDFAKPGWIYTRMVVLRDDSAAESEAKRDEIFYGIYYSLSAWKRWGLAPGSDSLAYFNTLESLVLSKRTLQLFRSQDEALGRSVGWSVFPTAFAQEEKKNKDDLEVPEKPKDKPLGLTGIHLDFLRQESIQVVKRKQKEKRAREALILQPREIKPITESVKAIVMGRLIVEREMRLPSLTQEEVDGSLYMRAILHRALEGCDAKTRDYWNERHLFAFRFYGLKNGKEEKNSWYQFHLPGGYFGVSHQAIAQAKDEAELAFLLIRPLIKEQRIEAVLWKAEGALWADQIQAQAAKVWDQMQKAQSTKLSNNLDIADELAVDMDASVCLAKSGYDWRAGLRYLQRLRAHKEEPWLKWFNANSVGMDLRIRQLEQNLDQSLKRGDFPDSQAINRKRFEMALALWNTSG